MKTRMNMKIRSNLMDRPALNKVGSNIVRDRLRKMDTRFKESLLQAIVVHKGEIIPEAFKNIPGLEFDQRGIATENMCWCKEGWCKSCEDVSTLLEEPLKRTEEPTNLAMVLVNKGQIIPEVFRGIPGVSPGNPAAENMCYLNDGWPKSCESESDIRDLGQSGLYSFTTATDDLKTMGLDSFTSSEQEALEELGMLESIKGLW